MCHSARDRYRAYKFREAATHGTIPYISGPRDEVRIEIKKNRI